MSKKDEIYSDIHRKMEEHIRDMYDAKWHSYDKDYDWYKKHARSSEMIEEEINERCAKFEPTLNESEERNCELEALYRVLTNLEDDSKIVNAALDKLMVAIRMQCYEEFDKQRTRAQDNVKQRKRSAFRSKVKKEVEKRSDYEQKYIESEYISMKEKLRHYEITKFEKMIRSHEYGKK